MSKKSKIINIVIIAAAGLLGLALGLPRGSRLALLVQGVCRCHGGAYEDGLLGRCFRGRLLGRLEAVADPVHVHHGRIDSECNGTDGRRRIRTDARKILKFPGGLRHNAAMLLHNLQGSPVQIADTAVVAQSLPEFGAEIFVCFCESFNGRKGIQEPFVVVTNCFDAGLLQHDFREPDMIRRRIRAPGQNTSVVVVPVQ